MPKEEFKVNYKDERRDKVIKEAIEQAVERSRTAKGRECPTESRE
jgi:hypothetical protein